MLSKQDACLKFFIHITRLACQNGVHIYNSSGVWESLFPHAQYWVLPFLFIFVDPNDEKSYHGTFFESWLRQRILFMFIVEFHF